VSCQAVEKLSWVSAREVRRARRDCHPPVCASPFLGQAAVSPQIGALIRIFQQPDAGRSGRARCGLLAEVRKEGPEGMMDEAGLNREDPWKAIRWDERESGLPVQADVR